MASHTNRQFVYAYRYQNRYYGVDQLHMRRIERVDLCYC